MSAVLHRPNLIKRIIYRMGIRPKPGSVWYSPSLAWIADMPRGQASGWNLAKSAPTDEELAALATAAIRSNVLLAEVVAPRRGGFTLEEHVANPSSRAEVEIRVATDHERSYGIRWIDHT